jgi:hypothetical protein
MEFYLHFPIRLHGLMLRYKESFSFDLLLVLLKDSYNENTFRSFLLQILHEYENNMKNSPVRCWEFFFSPPRPDLLWGPPSLLSSGYWGSSPGGKAVGAWSWSHTSIKCRGQECVELYLHSPSMSSWRDAYLRTGTTLRFLQFLHPRKHRFCVTETSCLSIYC